MPSRLTSRSLVAAGLALAVHAGCNGDSSPLSPSDDGLPMRAGRYVLNIHGADFSGSGTGPTVPACPGFAEAGIGDVSLELTGGPDGDAFTAAPANPLSGSVHLRLQRGLLMNGGGPFGPITVTGWAEGTGTHQNLPGNLAPLPPTQVRFDGRASLRGEVAPTGFAGFGMITGTLTFLNADGLEVRCNPGTASWSLSGPVGLP